MRALLWGILLLASGVRADDEAALALADTLPAAQAPARDWRAWLEIGSGVQWLRQPQGRGVWGRLALDAAFDTQLAPQWQAAGAARLDVRMDEGGGETSVLTFKELWAGYRPSATVLFDAGRINLHQGVAMGYNPSDFLRAHTVRTLVSIDPEVIRQNRLGTVMLRAQQLWSEGAVSLLLAPQLAREQDAGAASPDWGSSNGRARAQLQWSQRLTPAWAPEFLLFAEEGRALQLGLNQSVLLDDATVLYSEWSGGREASLLEAAQGEAGARRFRSRLAAGGALTLAGGGTFTAEFHYNQGAPGSAALAQLHSGSPALWQLWRQYALTMQDSPTRRALFMHYRHPDFAVSGLELAAMLRLDLQDHSALHWLQLRHVQPAYDVAVQLHIRSGGADSVWGGTGQRAVAELILRCFL